MAHANARLGPAGRRELVRLICEMKWPERRAAECLSVSPGDRASLEAALVGCERRGSPLGRVGAGSLKPAASLAAADGGASLRRAVCAARERTGWGPRLIAGETGVAHSTVHAIFKRHGCSRAPRAAREPFRRYEWPCPGDLLHMDVKRYPRFRRPGHAVTGDRRRTRQQRDQPARSRLLPRHRRRPLAPGLRRAARRREGRDRRRVRRARPGLVRRPRDHGPAADDRRRAGATAATARCASCCAQHGIRHIITPPYTPRWNGKVERFHQTMEREWAKGLRYRNSTARNRALPHWLRHYNQRRPHSSLGGQPPISRAHNLSGQDS